MRLVEQISQEITGLRDFLMDSLDFKPGAIAFTKSKLEACDEKRLQEILKWLKGFAASAPKTYAEARSKASEHAWVLYEAAGIKGTWEQTNLKRVKVSLRDLWRSRPIELRREKNGFPDLSTGRGNQKTKRKARNSRKSN